VPKTYTDEKRQTSQTFVIEKSSYVTDFEFSQCNACSVSQYTMPVVPTGGHNITIQDGNVTATMGTINIETSFEIVPEMNDVRCA